MHKLDKNTFRQCVYACGLVKQASEMLCMDIVHMERVFLPYEYACDAQISILLGSSYNNLDSEIPFLSPALL